MRVFLEIYEFLILEVNKERKKENLFYNSSTMAKENH